MKTIILCITLLFISGCNNSNASIKKGEQLYQISTIDALLAGLLTSPINTTKKPPKPYSKVKREETLNCSA